MSSHIIILAVTLKLVEFPQASMQIPKKLKIQIQIQYTTHMSGTRISSLCLVLF